MKRNSALLMIVALLVSAPALARKEMSATTPDGLELVPKTKFGAVYLEPNVDLSVYQTFGLIPCEVSFKKNWVREHNRDEIDLSNRVTQSDVDRIKKALADECDKYFKAALEEAPAYTLVDEFLKGDEVLILQPAIVNLDVTAPDLRTAGMERTYTASAGEMTLILEATDGTTGDAVARVYDREGGGNSSAIQWSNSVTNKAEADMILKRWTKQMRSGLDQLTKKQP
jgi:hypothetical protein